MTDAPTPDAEESGPESRFRRLRIALGVALVVLLGWILLVFHLFFSPPLAPISSADADADAVVVLGGAADERLEVGRQLVDDGVAERLVLSSTGLPGNAAADALCSTGAPDVVCFRPDPLTTRGEARAIAALAREQDWDSVVVVTSTYHVTRASVHLSQCSTAHVSMAASEPDLGPSQWLRRFVEESVALAAAYARPACTRAV